MKELKCKSLIFFTNCYNNIDYIFLSNITVNIIFLKGNPIIKSELQGNFSKQIVRLYINSGIINSVIILSVKPTIFVSFEARFFYISFF